MRTAIALFVLLTACSTTYDCECCAGPDRQVVHRFVDTDEDGLPDARLPLGADRARYQRIERSLENLERAIAEVRRAMR